MEKECLTCKKNFKIAPYQFERRKYCSVSCVVIARQRGEVKTKRNRKKAISCLNCQSSFLVAPCEVNTKKYCSKKCYSLSQEIDVEINCLQCLKEFSVKPFFKELTKYCSNECRNLAKRKRIIKNCLTCKVKFQVRNCENKTKKYCSKKCYDTGKISRIQKNCVTCKKEFEVCLYNKEKKYCSKKCNGIGAQTQVKKACLYCKIDFSVPPHLYKRKKICSLECRLGYFKKRQIKKNCLNCKKEIFVSPSAVNKKYCSVNCHFSSASRNETDIEKKLRLALESAEIQYKTQHKIGKYYVDFAIIQKNLAIEADGEYWHQDNEKDSKRDSVIESYGWRILHFTGTEIKRDVDKCLKIIQQVL